MFRPSSLEPLEARIAPALVVVNSLADILAGAGQTGATVELGQLLDSSVAHPGHTLVKFTLNLDQDPNTPGIQLDTDATMPGIQPPTIVLELFDDKAPLTVQNFLRYVENPITAADFVNTFFHRSISGFVVQGGGFDASAQTTHIATFSTVHNEFSADRSNLRGTIAMAKVGTDPNSATSEWFVNLANNSANLDNQNGGFTVFGQIDAGMNFIDQIAALPKTNQGGALTDLPVQNFSGSGSTKPTADNLITITGVTVTRPQPGDTTGLSYQVVSINDTAGAPSDLLTDTLTGSSLKLNYVAGKSGVADVTVRVTQQGTGDTVDDTFRVTVKPNLIASIGTDSLANILVPGDSLKPSIKLTNNGAAQFQGPVDVHFFLSPITTSDSDGRHRDADDLEIARLLNQTVTIASDGSATVTGSTALLTQLSALDTTGRLLAEVTPVASELFSDDNVALDGGAHAYANQFGNISIAGVGTRTNAKLTYMDAANHAVSFSLTGAGVGHVSQTGSAIDLYVSGTNSASVLNLTTTAHTSLHNLDFASPIGTAALGLADVSGYVTASNGLKTLTLGNISGSDSTLILGAFGTLNTTGATLNFGSVHDFNIESDQPIAALNATEWLDPSAIADHITAPSLAKLNIKGSSTVRGDFEADVNLTRVSTLSSFTVKGFLHNSTVTTLGNVGSVSLGGMKSSNFFVGTSARPSVLGDFASKHTITSFAIKGVAFPGAGSTFFADSQVAASTISAIVVKGVDGDSGSGSFGFVADKVGSYTRDAKPALLNLSAPKVLDPLGSHYSLTIL